MNSVLIAGVWVDTLRGGAGENPAIMMHLGRNDNVRRRWEVIKCNFRDCKLRAKTSNVVSSEILRVPRVTPGRQKDIREVNKWHKNWCRKVGFRFVMEMGQLCC